MEEREVPLSALTATAQNIAEEFPNLEEERESPGVMDEVRTYLCSLVFLKDFYEQDRGEDVSVGMSHTKECSLL